MTHGGLGQNIQIDNSHPEVFSIDRAFEGVEFPALGYAGGGPGARGYVGLINGQVLSSKAGILCQSARGSSSRQVVAIWAVPLLGIRRSSLSTSRSVFDPVLPLGRRCRADVLTCKSDQQRIGGMFKSRCLLSWQHQLKYTN